MEDYESRSNLCKFHPLARRTIILVAIRQALQILQQLEGLVESNTEIKMKNTILDKMKNRTLELMKKWTLD
jgi:hypothetical protein